MSGIIPKEQLAAYQRWQLGSFDAPAATPEPAPAAPPPPAASAPPAAPAGEPVEPPPALPTAEDIERIHEEARQAGFEAGFAEGRTAAEEAAREATQTLVGEMIELTRHMEEALTGLDQSVAEQLLELGLEIARQLALGTIAADPDYLLPIIREAIAALPLHHAHIVIHLNPRDAGNVRPHLESLAGNAAQIVEDGTVAAGGCRIRAGASEIDATIETRWQRVLEAIGANPEAWMKRP